jgi:hypothetical protein
MTRCLMLLLAIVLVFLFAGVVSASVKQGETELDFQGGFLSENGAGDEEDYRIWYLAGALGYFLTDNIEVAPAAAWVSVDNEEETDVWALGGRAAYHFMPGNQWVPYIGGQVFWADSDSDDDAYDAQGTLWGPFVGLRYELNENNDFFAEYQYHIWSGDIHDVLEDGHALMVGIIHQFKK